MKTATAEALKRAEMDLIRDLAGLGDAQCAAEEAAAAEIADCDPFGVPPAYDAQAAAALRGVAAAFAEAWDIIDRAILMHGPEFRRAWDVSDKSPLDVSPQLDVAPLLADYVRGCIKSAAPAK